MSLRAFRIEKKPSQNGEASPIKQNGHEQVHVQTPTVVKIVSVQQQEEQPQPIVLSSKEKENRLVELRQKNPNYDIMSIQDALIKTSWDVEKATDYLVQYCRPNTRYQSAVPLKSGMKTVVIVSQKTGSPQLVKVTPVSQAPMQTKQVYRIVQTISPQQKVAGALPVQRPSSKPYSRIKRPADSDKETDESDFDEKPKGQVFDSDEDSDEAEFLSKDRKSVFEFMNNAKLCDLVLVKSLSQKKAEVIIEHRPYTSWFDLTERFRKHKQLSTEILNNCQEYIERRNNLSNIMKKCSKIVRKIGTAIENGSNVLQQPALMNEELKLAEYQLIGLNWLALLFKNDVNGILADEMGLGKTVQIISFLAHLKETKQAKKCHLIVVPSSTLNNWQQEIERWCPSLVVQKYHGDQETRRHMRIKIAKECLTDTDILLTTYHMIGASNEEKKMFRVVKFHYVVFDEAHMLKNMTSQRYQVLARICADRRILLTGTPLQNNLLELMSLLCFVMPNMIGSKAEDIKALFSNKTKKAEGSEGAPDDLEMSQIEQAKSIMKPFLLRRLKKDVLTFLPPKTSEVIKVPLTDSQQQKYRQLIQHYKSESTIAEAERNVSGMTLLMDMRKLANHPLLLRYHFTDDKVRKMANALAKDPSYKNTKADEIFQDIAYLSDFKLYQMAEKHHSLINLVRIPDAVVLDNGKFRVLDELLPRLKAEGHRVLIFSQFVMMLDVIEKYLEIRQMGFLRLDGSTAVEERQDMINLYNQDDGIFIFLLSTRAGGLGINLTAADTVIIYDIDFNPYNDKQAEDRCHRIGQTKEVTVYKLIAEGTIEEGMASIADDKLKLEQEVTSEEAEAKEEHKCVVRLLTMALGMDESRAEHLLSPSQQAKKKKTAEESQD